MKVIKILNIKYKSDEIEANSKIIRKWLIIKQVKKEKLIGKYHQIDSIEKVEAEYKEIYGTLSEENQEFYRKYLNENWTETHPIMKDVSRYSKIRPDDGIEFCVMV